MNLKQTRGQLRQIVKEVLPEVLTTELRSALYAEIAKVVSARLNSIEKDVKRTMDEINTRSKDATDYLVRNVSTPIQVPSSTNTGPVATQIELS